MMAPNTSALIERLAREAGSVTRLRRPWARALSWVGLSLGFIAAVVLRWPFQEGFSLRPGDGRFIFEQAAAFGLAVTAAVAAFATTVPGYDRRILLLPVVPLALWMGHIGGSCIQDVLAHGFRSWFVGAHWPCLTTTIGVGTAPAVGIAVMLRRGAPLSPHLTTALGAVAASGLANFGVRFVHGFDASLIVLTWHVGTLVACSLVAGVAGRSLLKWRLSPGQS